MFWHVLSWLAPFAWLALVNSSFGRMPPQLSDSEQEVQRLGALEVEALLKRDTETLATLWSENLVVTNPLNHLVTKSDILGMIRSGFLQHLVIRRTVEYIHDFGEVVVVAGTEVVRWGGTIPIAGKDHQVRFTAVWQRTHEGWIEIIRHGSLVPPL